MRYHKTKCFYSFTINLQLTLKNTLAKKMPVSVLPDRSELFSMVWSSYVTYGVYWHYSSDTGNVWLWSSNAVLHGVILTSFFTLMPHMNQCRDYTSVERLKTTTRTTTKILDQNLSHFINWNGNKTTNQTIYCDRSFKLLID